MVILWIPPDSTTWADKVSNLSVARFSIQSIYYLFSVRSTPYCQLGLHDQHLSIYILLSDSVDCVNTAVFGKLTDTPYVTLIILIHTVWFNQVTAHGYLPNIQQFGVDKDVVTQLEIILTQIIPNKDGSGPALLPLCQDQIILLDCPKDETEKREDFLRQVAELD